MSESERQGGSTKERKFTLEPNQSIIFDYYPFPPSSNALYTTRMLRGRSRRMKSKELIDYQKKCEQWDLINPQLRQTAYHYLKDEPAIELEIFVGVAKSKIWTKKGDVKKYDVSNRGKALLDCLGDSIGIDDKYFSRITMIKVEVDNEAQQMCFIRFSRDQIVHMKDIKRAFKRLLE